jgi:hypothetical protein
VALAGRRWLLAAGLLAGCAAAENSASPIIPRIPVARRVARIDIRSDVRAFDVGDSALYVATLRDSSGSVLVDRPSFWLSSDTSVAIVERSGLVRTVGVGAARISLTAESVTAHVDISVAADPVTQVAVGNVFACALRRSGRLFCWGSAPNGYFARATEVFRQFSWRSIVAAYGTICGVTTDRDAYCWGSNNFGQIGDGGQMDQPSPRLVAGGMKWASLHRVIYATCGVEHITARIFCWGGVGSTGSEASPSPTPTLLPSVTVAAEGNEQVTAGSAHLCGRNPKLGFWCIGATGVGQWTTPRTLAGPAVIVSAVAIGMGKTCTITSAGEAFCFGENDGSTLSNGDGRVGTLLLESAPRLAPAVRWKYFAQGIAFHYCGIDVNDRGYCWGTNYSGQVGNGSTVFQSTPSLLPGHWQQFAIGMGIHGWSNRNFTCGLSTAHEVLCWGEAARGQLGESGIATALTPRRVRIPQVTP